MDSGTVIHRSQLKMDINGTLCLENGIPTITSWPYRLAILIHIFLTFSSLVFMMVAFFYLRKRLYFHKNITILIVFMFVSASVLSLQMLVMECRHIFISWFYKHPCDVYVPAEDCFPYLLLNSVAIGCMTGAQVCMVIERMIATYLMKKYQKFGGELGTILVVCTTMIFVWLTYETFWPGPSEDYYLTCISIPKESAVKANRNFIILISLNLMCIISLILLNAINRPYRKRLRFNLADRYQVEENLNTTQYICTIVIVQFVILTFYGTGTLLLRTFKAKFEPIFHRQLIMFVVPFFTCILPILMIYIVKQGVERRNRNINKMVSHAATGTHGRDNYFHELLKQWS
ncbi:unnamed protein product [Auanema sp. JU1783]|nr:unnamed protein product [Auanema sp. JU1783]